jgi:hypothetical protein
MDNLDKLKFCILEVNDLLSQYIEIHNKVLKSAGTFRSLFRKVDFQELRNDIGMLLKDFISKDTEIGELRSDIYNSLTPLQKEFFDCFSGYSEALLKTVNLLFKQVELLYNRSKNEDTLGWSGFSRISKEYNESINGYLVFGKILNKLYKEIYE